MKTAIQAPEYFYPALEGNKESIFSKFMDFCEKQEPNHFGWVGAGIMSQASVFFPLTLLVILATGASFMLISFSIVALALVVVTNLAALPTKITIPAMALSLLIDIVLVTLALL